MNTFRSIYVSLLVAMYSISANAKITQTVCQDIENDKGNTSWTNRALPSNTLLVLHELPRELGRTWDDVFGHAKAINVIPTLTKAPTNGRLVLLKPGNLWQYFPKSAYTGKDQATFRVDTPKGTYHVVVNLWVTEYVDEYAKEPSCKTAFQ